VENKKILIIDDDSRNIFALKAVLKAKKYECITANSAKDGIDALNSDSSIGIVLMDMMMPDMDGYEAIKHIRQSQQLKNKPVIAVTAQAMLGDKERCIEAGADGYISKPINIDELMKQLKAHL
jgi:two-component system cell cycle response regulator DivK